MAIGILSAIIIYLISRNILATLSVFYFVTGIRKTLLWISLPTPYQPYAVTRKKYINSIISWPLIVFLHKGDPINDYFKSLSTGESEVKRVDKIESINDVKEKNISELIKSFKKATPIVKYYSLIDERNITFEQVVSLFNCIVDRGKYINYDLMRVGHDGFNFVAKIIEIDSTKKEPFYYYEEIDKKKLDSRSFYKYISCQTDLQGLENYFFLQMSIDRLSFSYLFPEYSLIKIITDRTEISKYMNILFEKHAELIGHFRIDDYPFTKYENDSLSITVLIDCHDGIFLKKI